MNKLNHLLDEIINGLFWLDMGFGIGLLAGGLIKASRPMIGLGLISIICGLLAKLVSSESDPNRYV